MPAADLSRANWRKSSRSGGTGNDGNCVEVALVAPAVAVRDSKRPNSGALIFDKTAWGRFLRTL
jgi:hypothetical protein